MRQAYQCEGCGMFSTQKSAVKKCEESHECEYFFVQYDKNGVCAFQVDSIRAYHINIEEAKRAGLNIINSGRLDDECSLEKYWVGNGVLVVKHIKGPRLSLS